MFFEKRLYDRFLQLHLILQTHCRWLQETRWIIVREERREMHWTVLICSFYLLICDVTYSFQYATSWRKTKVCSSSYRWKNSLPKLSSLPSIRFLSTSDEQSESEATGDHYYHPEEGIDMFGDTTDEELLEKYRVQKVLNNDRWQMSIMEDLHCGSWIGTISSLIPSISHLILLYYRVL